VRLPSAPAQKKSSNAHPLKQETASHSQYLNNQIQREPAMRKIAFLLAAFVVFTPVAYAALHQAALIVA
jgi:hypothetical protein